MPRPEDSKTAKAGQRAALFLAGVGVFWVLAIWAGSAFNLPVRVRALLDLFALAGFGWALWMTYLVWRARQPDKAKPDKAKPDKAKTDKR